MMTGEWNISALDEIHATVRTRRADFGRWAATKHGALLVGEREAHLIGTGLPGAGGNAAGPLRRREITEVNGCQGAVVGVFYLGNASALSLPVADGFVAANGTPVDPLAVAARPWHRPVVLALGDRYETLTDGAQTAIDGDAAVVDQ